MQYKFRTNEFTLHISITIDRLSKWRPAAAPQFNILFSSYLSVFFIYFLAYLTNSIIPIDRQQNSRHCIENPQTIIWYFQRKAECKIWNKKKKQQQQHFEVQEKTFVCIFLAAVQCISFVLRVQDCPERKCQIIKIPFCKEQIAHNFLKNLLLRDNFFPLLWNDTNTMNLFKTLFAYLPMGCSASFSSSKERERCVEDYRRRRRRHQQQKRET